MASQRIFLFRHGETVWNAEKRRQGHLDTSLTETGRLQARQNANRLRDHATLDGELAVYSSPLGRAKHTSEIIVGELGLSANTIAYDDRLMEASFGAWDGLTDDEVTLRYPDLWQARSADKWDVRPPSGESYADVHARIVDWYGSADLAETTLVVCHGLTSRVFRGIYAGLSHAQVFALPEPHEGFFELQDGAIKYIC